MVKNTMFFHYEPGDHENTVTARRACSPLSHHVFAVMRRQPQSQVPHSGTWLTPPARSSQAIWPSGQEPVPSDLAARPRARPPSLAQKKEARFSPSFPFFSLFHFPLIKAPQPPSKDSAQSPRDLLHSPYFQAPARKPSPNCLVRKIPVRSHWEQPHPAQPLYLAQPQ